MWLVAFNMRLPAPGNSICISSVFNTQAREGVRGVVLRSFDAVGRSGYRNARQEVDKTAPMSESATSLTDPLVMERSYQYIIPPPPGDQKQRCRATGYGNIAVMFLFQGFHAIGWTPLLYLYPAKVMNYSIRANGVALSSFVLNAFAYITRSL